MTTTTGYNIHPLITGLVKAGFISDTASVTRVVVDVQGGASPLVYVQYAGDPDKITDVLTDVARAMPIVETSTVPHLASVGGQAAIHREDALRYARLVEHQRRGNLQAVTT